ncbi:MAG: hypothetical protein QXS17_02515 [Candidatus Micrarchaeaceae archaeon]
MITYEEALNMVKSVESRAQQQGSFVVNPDDIMPGIEVKTLDYSSALKLMGFAKYEKSEEQQPQAQAQPIEQEKPTMTGAPYAAASATPSAPAPSSLTAQTIATAQAAAKAEAKQTKPRPILFKKELNEAAKRIESVAGAGSTLRRSFSEAREQRQLKGLVLPTLSLNDQISDLEKIDEGLKEHVFNSEQLKIIKLEANGLSRLIAEGKQNAAPTDLAELRNALLKEVFDEVNTYAV